MAFQQPGKFFFAVFSAVKLYVNLFSRIALIVRRLSERPVEARGRNAKIVRVFDGVVFVYCGLYKAAYLLAIVKAYPFRLVGIYDKLFCAGGRFYFDPDIFIAKPFDQRPYDIFYYTFSLICYLKHSKRFIYPQNAIKIDR